MEKDRRNARSFQFYLYNLKKLEQNSTNTGLNVTYAPVHNFNSGTPTKEDIIASNRISQKEFETMLNDVLKKNKRLSFA